MEFVTSNIERGCWLPSAQQTSEITSLQREKVHFGSQFWGFPSMVSGHVSFGPVAGVCSRA